MSTPEDIGLADAAAPPDAGTLADALAGSEPSRLDQLSPPSMAPFRSDIDPDFPDEPFDPDEPLRVAFWARLADIVENRSLIAVRCAGGSDGKMGLYRLADLHPEVARSQVNQLLGDVAPRRTTVKKRAKRS